LHLFSAAPDLVEFGRSAYRQRSEETSLLLRQLFESFREEDLAMSYTMRDFKRDFFTKHFAQLTPEEQEEVLQGLPLEQRLAGLSAEQMRQYLDRLNAERPAKPRKPRRKK
jgi:hypothetical protein